MHAQIVTHNMLLKLPSVALKFQRKFAFLIVQSFRSRTQHSCAGRHKMLACQAAHVFHKYVQMCSLLDIGNLKTCARVL